MTVHMALGEDFEFRLSAAILVYSGVRDMFATLHEVTNNPHGGAPLLRPGQALTTEFLRELCEGLGRRVRAEILPANVLVRTPECIVWWAPRTRRVMFFSKRAANGVHETLNGRIFPHPPRVFKVVGRDLFVRALDKEERPGPDTKLKVAPYWNLNMHEGRCCQGSMRSPAQPSVSALEAWERAFFESEFSHPLGAVRLTTHPGGFPGLWAELAGSREPFPFGYLADAGETLQQFIERN